MEQKVVDRYNETLKLLNERIAEFNRDKDMFFKEFFNDEMKGIMKSVIVGTGRNIQFPLTDEWMLSISSSFYPEFYRPTNVLNSHTFYTGELKGNEDFNRGRVVQLENHVKNFRLVKNMFDIFVDRAEEIICYIVTEYRNINEDCMNRLDGVMNILGENMEDIKHIKITVEWI